MSSFWSLLRFRKAAAAGSQRKLESSFQRVVKKKEEDYQHEDTLGA